MVDESNKFTIASERAVAPEGGIICELFEGRVHAEFGLLHTCNQHQMTAKEFCVSVQGCSRCDRARLGRGVRSNGYGLLREGISKIRESNGVCSISEHSASLVGAAGETRAEHVGQFGGPAAGNLLWNGFPLSCGGTIGHTQCIGKPLSQHALGCHRLTKSLGRAPGAALGRHRGGGGVKGDKEV